MRRFFLFEYVLINKFLEICTHKRFSSIRSCTKYISMKFSSIHFPRKDFQQIFIKKAKLPRKMKNFNLFQLNEIPNFCQQKKKYFHDRKEMKKNFLFQLLQTFSFCFQGQFDTMKCSEFMYLHSDIIRQIFYLSNLNSIISASESSLTSDPYLPGVIITNLSVQNSQTVFKMNNVS